MKPEPKHTPGPWRQEVVGGDLCIVAGSNPASIVLEVCELGPDYEHQDANAHLIAAAPDLLKALANLLKYANRYSDEMSKIGRGAEQLGNYAPLVSVAGMARAAIAKATGD